MVQPEKPDNLILATAAEQKSFLFDIPVVLVTKDINLRVKAAAMQIEAEDYRSGDVKQGPYKGHRVIEDANLATMDSLYREHEGLPAKLLIEEELTEHEYLVIRNGSVSSLAQYNSDSGNVSRIGTKPAYGIAGKNVEQHFALHALMDNAVPLVTVTGRAGTGKTLLALAAALEVRSAYLQIMLARPIVPLSNKDIGALPGDIGEKIGPYMQPLFDNLGVIKGQTDQAMAQRLDKMLEEHKLVIEPLPYIRGRSLMRMFLIIDEAQNLTPHEIKTIITRAGEGTKVVFTGDVHQIDHPYLNQQDNGLSYLIEHMKGQKIFAHVNLEKGERSNLSMIASELL